MHRWATYILTMGLWLCSTDALLSQYRVKTIDVSKTITVLHSKEDGSLQYGTDSGEIGLYNGRIFLKYQSLPGRINDIQSDGQTEYYLSAAGLYRFQTDQLTQLSPNNSSVIDKSSDNTLLATSTGIYNQVGSDYVPDRESFYAVNEIAQADILQFDNRPLLRIDETIYQKDKSWKPLVLMNRQFDFLPFRDKLIIADDKGIISYDNQGYIDTLYRSDTSALVKIFPLSGNDILYCSNDQVSIFDMRSREMINIREIKTDLIQTATVDKWGNTWIAAGSFLYQIIDQKNTTANNPPELTINNIEVDGNNHPIEQEIRLKPDINNLEITYTGIQLTHPQDLEYSHRLVPRKNSPTLGILSEWSALSPATEAEYQNLPSGRYDFELRTSIDGQYYTYIKPIRVNATSDSLQYYWWIGLAGALGILLTAIFFNSRYNRLKEQSVQERNRLIKENKMLALQQKALQLQMNPHFVFNALNSIQGLIAKEDNKSARRYLQQFSTMMRSVLNQSREDTISIEDEVTYLKSYLSIEQMANNQNFDYDIIVDEEIDSGIRIPTMIIQPFIENAIIHGVKSLKKRRGHIRLSLALSDYGLVCTLNDNGIGRAAAAKHKISNHKSIAIDVVNERLRSKDNDNNVMYKDLKDDQGHAAGTSVVIKIPVFYSA